MLSHNKCSRPSSLPPVDVPQVPFLDENEFHGLPDDGNTAGCTGPDDSAENVLKISWLQIPTCVPEFEAWNAC